MGLRELGGLIRLVALELWTSILSARRPRKGVVDVLGFDHDRASYPEIVVRTLQLRDGGFRGQRPEGVVGQMLLAEAACSCFFWRVVCQR